MAPTQLMTSSWISRSTRGKSQHENSEWTELAYHSSDVALPLRTLPEGAHAKEYAEDMQQNLTDLALSLAK